MELSFPPPVFHSKFKTTFCTPTRLLRIFTLYSRVDFKIFVDALKVLSWFVKITYAHAFLDALPAKFSIWSLLSPACFEVFPHFPRRLRWRPSPDPLRIPLIDVPLVHFGLAFPWFSVLRLVFPHFTSILRRWPDHLSPFKILFFHSGDRDRGFGFLFCDWTTPQQKSVVRPASYVALITRFSGAYTLLKSTQTNPERRRVSFQDDASLL